MSTISRSALVRGPATAKVGSVALHANAGVTMDFTAEAVPVMSDVFGEIDRLVSAKYIETQLTPVGALSAGILALLHPQQTPDLGGSLLGATDTPLIVHSKAGVKITAANCGVWSPPNIRLSATKTAFSSAVNFRSGLKNNTSPDADGAFYTLASEAWTTAAYALGASTILAGAVTAAIGATAVTSQDGYELAATYNWQPVLDDNVGIPDWTLDSVSASISFTPSSGTEAALLALMPFAQDIGTSVRSGADFVVSSANGLTMTIYDAFLLKGPLRFGRTMLRQGQLAFAGLAKVTSDVPGAVYALALS